MGSEGAGSRFLSISVKMCLHRFFLKIHYSKKSPRRTPYQLYTSVYHHGFPIFVPFSCIEFASCPETSIITLQCLQEQRQQHLLRCGSRVSGASRQSGNSGFLAATRSWEMRRGLKSSHLKRWRASKEK